MFLGDLGSAKEASKTSFFWNVLALVVGLLILIANTAYVVVRYTSLIDVQS